MKKILALVMLAVFVSGCTISEYRYLKGDYYRGIIWQDSPMTFDQTFTKSIEVLTQSGVIASVLDRQNGFIKLTAAVSGLDISFERNGKVRSPDRFIVAPENTFFQAVVIDVIILVQPTSEGSRVGVRLIPSNTDRYIEGVRGETASLGNFEKSITKAIVGQ